MCAAAAPLPPASAAKPAAPNVSIPASYAMSVLASLLFGLAIVPRNGAFDSGALALCIGGLLVLSVLFVKQLLGRTTFIEGSAIFVLLRLIWVALFCMAWAAANDVWLLVSVGVPWVSGRAVQAFLLLMLCTYLPALLIPRLREGAIWRHVRFGLFACAVLLGGWFVLQASPHPTIDVWELQQEGARLLSAGHNPYPAVAVHDTGIRAEAFVPYAYPPMQLYATLPAFVVGGDVRYAMVVAVVLTGLALRALASRKSGIPSLAQDAPALLLWLSPKLFLILEQAWVDPVGLALLCGAVYAYVARRLVMAAILFGLAFGAKQTMFWLIPLAALLPAFSRRQWFVALGTTAASVLPFVIWDWHALYNATVTFVVDMPARLDALTLLNWYYYYTGWTAPTWLGVILAAAVVALAIWRLPKSVCSFSVAVSLTYAVLFTFSKIAFANYYFLVSGLAALAAATAFHVHTATEE
jgi:hypothetical protein